MRHRFLNKLSNHLFWDVDASKLNVERNKKLIIHRDLDYGTLSDWQLIYDCYGIDEIAKTAMSIEDIESKSASFVSLLSNIFKDKFL